MSTFKTYKVFLLLFSSMMLLSCSDNVTTETIQEQLYPKDSDFQLHALTIIPVEGQNKKYQRYLVSGSYNFKNSKPLYTKINLKLAQFEFYKPFPQEKYEYNGVFNDAGVVFFKEDGKLSVIDQKGFPDLRTVFDGNVQYDWDFNLIDINKIMEVTNIDKSDNNQKITMVKIDPPGNLDAFIHQYVDDFNNVAELNKRLILKEEEINKQLYTVKRQRGIEQDNVYRKYGQIKDKINSAVFKDFSNRQYDLIKDHSEKERVLLAEIKGLEQLIKNTPFASLDEASLQAQTEVLKGQQTNLNELRDQYKKLTSKIASIKEQFSQEHKKLRDDKYASIDIERDKELNQIQQLISTQEDEAKSNLEKEKQLFYEEAAPHIKDAYKGMYFALSRYLPNRVDCDSLKKHDIWWVTTEGCMKFKQADSAFQSVKDNDTRYSF